METIKIMQDQATRTISNLVHFFRQRGYEPGERLPSERDLSERFGVTRSVLREALKALEWMRFVERKSNSGLFMRAKGQAEASIETLVMYSIIGVPFDPETDLECIEVRRLLEVQAVKNACRRRTDGNTAAMQDIIEKSQNLAGEGPQLSKLDFEFHMQIFKATQNRVLVQIVTPFYLMSEARREKFFAVKGNFLQSFKEHQKILEAIEARAEDEAAALMSRHIGHVERYFGSTTENETSIQE